MMLPYAIGIDIGGTNTVFGLVDRRGVITGKGRMATTGYATARHFTDALAAALRPLIAEAGKDTIGGIGVGAPNANYHTGEIVDAPNLAWKGVIPIGEMLRSALDLPVTVTNDANAAALGEMTYGAAKGMNDFIMVTLGTGVGSGIVVRGGLVYGHDGFAGELGHMIAVRDGRLCGCGRKGCLETYCSATGLVRTAQERLAASGEETVLRDARSDLTALAIQEAAKSGDPFALSLYTYTAGILGRSLAEAAVITSPQAFILFGGLAHAGDMLLRPLKRSMEEALLPILRNKIAILPSELPGGDAAILGASSLCW